MRDFDVFEHFSDPAVKVMAFANKEAIRFNQKYIMSEHMLLGILNGENTFAVAVLKKLGVDLAEARGRVESARQSNETDGKAKRIVELTIAEANQLGDRFVGTEHLLLGLLHPLEPATIPNVVLGEMGVTLEMGRATVAEMIASGMKREKLRRFAWIRRLVR